MVEAMTIERHRYLLEGEGLPTWTQTPGVFIQMDMAIGYDGKWRIWPIQ